MLGALSGKDRLFVRQYKENAVITGNKVVCTSHKAETRQLWESLYY